MRHIRRLRDEGKLKNMGGAMQPIYVPGSGYYGNNKEVSVKRNKIGQLKSGRDRVRVKVTLTYSHLYPHACNPDE